jgi:3'-5' exoribonuclease
MQMESGNSQSGNPRAWVSDMKPGDVVQSVFQVTRINLREFDKGKFLTLRLGDRTGKVTGILWTRAEEIFQSIVEGDLAIVEGRVGVYQEETQIKIQSIHKVDDPEQYDRADFLPISPTPVEILIQDFDFLLENIKDADYKALLMSFRQDESLWSRFIVAPGAKRWHHPYLHGLLDHTLSVVKICKQIGHFYPEIDLDLLATGAIFHDCGKIDEFIYQTQIDYSTEGRLLGHLFQGTLIVERLIAKIPNFPQKKRMQLLHIIASHHGEVERSPVLPMTLEASLLHHVENLDAQMAALRREIAIAKKEKRTWTGFIKLLERSLYLGESGERSDNTPEDEKHLEDERI